MPPHELTRAFYLSRARTHSAPFGCLGFHAAAPSAWENESGQGLQTARRGALLPSCCVYARADGSVRWGGCRPLAPIV
jgi:hypothetical protein